MLARSCRRYRATGHLPTVASLASVLLIVACSDAPLQPLAHRAVISAASTVVPAQLSVTRAEEATLQGVGSALPEFGGFFFDSAGNLVAYLTDLSRSQQGAAVLRPILSAYKYSNTLHKTGAIVFRQGQFGIGQLAAMRDRMTLPVLSLSAVVYTDLDEARNRLVVGVRGMPAARSVMSVLASLGIPSGAVIIEKAELAQSAGESFLDPAPHPASTTTLTLQSEVSPKGGGVQVYQRTYTTGKTCTFGFSANRSSGDKVFVTTSGCTNKTWDSDPADFWQPDFTKYLGQEVSDPVGTHCLPLLTCRYSAGVLVSHNYLSSLYFSLGLVYPTVNRVTGVSGSLTLASHTGVIEHEIGGVVVGHELDKIGSRTGWTYGPVTKTCTDIKISSRIYQCSTQASGMHAWFGDEGAPVLDYSGYSASYYRFSLHGMIFALSTYLGSGNFKYVWISPISGIETDLGALTTHT